MADYQRDYLYCSPLLPVQSLDSQLSNRRSAVFNIRDTEDDPETALIKARDGRRLHDWVGTLPGGLLAVAGAILGGETQASIARRLGVSEAAVSKRITRLAERGRRELQGLRRSPLLQ